MFIFCLFAATLFIGFFNNMLNKKFQLGFKSDFEHFIGYNFFNALFAMIVFFISSKFKIEMNSITMIFSLIYACIVMINLVLSIKSLSCVSVSLCCIIVTAGQAILSSLFGILVLNEAISLRLLVSVGLMLASVFVPAVRLKNDGKKNNIFVCIGLFLVSGAAVILNKIYTLAPNVCNTKSYFFMTNLIITVVCLCVLAIIVKKNPSNAKNIIFPFSKIQMANIASRTVLSNIASVISVILLANMNISVYSVISNSIGVLSGAVLSALVFKENMTRENKLAVICAVAAIIISP